MRSASINIHRDLLDHQLNPNGMTIAAKFVAKVLILVSSDNSTDALQMHNCKGYVLRTYS